MRRRGPKSQAVVADRHSNYLEDMVVGNRLVHVAQGVQGVQTVLFGLALVGEPLVREPL